MHLLRDDVVIEEPTCNTLTFLQDLWCFYDCLYGIEASFSFSDAERTMVDMLCLLHIVLRTPHSFDPLSAALRRRSR